MKRYLFPLILILMSCTRSIKDEFRATIIAYQKEFPAPADTKENDADRIYIYHAYFTTIDKDTVFAVHRTYSKIENGLYENRKIFQDKEMKPLEIFDIHNISGDLTDEAAKKQGYSFWDVGRAHDEQYTTRYWYKVKNNKIQFMKKDTSFVEVMHQRNEQLNIK